MIGIFSKLIITVALVAVFSISYTLMLTSQAMRKSAKA